MTTTELQSAMEQSKVRHEKFERWWGENKEKAMRRNQGVREFDVAKALWVAYRSNNWNLPQIDD